MSADAAEDGLREEEYAATAERLVRARLAYYGYTAEQVEAMLAPVDHRALGCEPTEHGWQCENEYGTSNHPHQDEAAATAEWVTWVLDNLAEHQPMAREGECTCRVYRVSDKAFDREDDPECPIHAQPAPVAPAGEVPEGYAAELMTWVIESLVALGAPPPPDPDAEEAGRG